MRALSKQKVSFDPLHYKPHFVTKHRIGLNATENSLARTAMCARILWDASFGDQRRFRSLEVAQRQPMAFSNVLID